MHLRPEEMRGTKILAGRKRALVSGFAGTGLCVALLALGGCAHDAPQYSIDAGAPKDTAANASPDADRTRRQPQDQQDDSQMRSSTDKNNNWGDAFTAPLEDLNLKRQQIPDILESAITKPYDLTGLDHCEAIAAEVAKLDTLLGKDFDEPPPPPDQRTNTEKGKEFANESAVGAVRNAARSIIPFRGLVRQMTGADRHAKEMDTAIQAGKVRRAYLKGVGMNKNCAPPAAPSWFKPRVYVENYVQEPVAAPPPTTGRKSAPPPRGRSGTKHR